MNRHFVCVKVDREERPDLDEIYMQATLALNRNQGGWPMTVFLTPDQKPFFAGTYFPPEDRWGRPGFPTLLKKIAEYWEKDPAGLHVVKRRTLRPGCRTALMPLLRPRSAKRSLIQPSPNSRKISTPSMADSAGHRNFLPRQASSLLAALLPSHERCPHPHHGRENP